MTLKSATGKLYTLFSACLPDNENVNKRLFLEQLVESTEYRELKNYEPMKNLFEPLFSKSVLSKLSMRELKKIEKAIPEIIPTVSKLINSIHYGDAWKLKNGDIPDFYSYDSLIGLKNKINVTDAANITNIADDNFFAIFSDKTVRSIEKLQGCLTVSDLKNINDAMKVQLKDKIYCIDEHDSDKIKDQFNAAMEELDKYERSLKYQARKHTEIKLMITAVIILILEGMSVSGLLHGMSIYILLIVAVIATVIYWKKG